MNLASKNKVHIESGMSALSDIIFMLLIFFIIASTMAVNGEQVDLPKVAPGTPTQATTTVTINANLEYAIDNVPIPKEQVESRLQEIYANSTDKKIVLNVDRSVPTGETIELFAVLRHNNWQPFIATKPKEGQP